MRIGNRRWTVATRPIFPSRNPLGIPDLLPQSVSIPQRLATRTEDSGSGSLVMDRTLRPRPGSTIGFFVDDYRLEPLWSTPGLSLRRLQSYAPAAVIEPDFSQYADHPPAMAHWNQFRARWLARWWQEQGLTVIPSLNWTPRTLDCVAYGIPRGSVVVCEARPRFKDLSLLLTGLQEAVKKIRPEAVLMYGAAEDLKGRVPPGPVYCWVPAWSPKLRLQQHS